MIHKISNSVLIGLIIIYIVVMMYALRMTFATVNANTESNKDSLVTLHGNQEAIVDNMFQLTEITEEMAHQIFINEVEINRLKNELGMPNDITNQAEEIFNVLAEENVE
jgi:hypothetical protein|tara:strand:+ start:429 stop:755 length:327 start_codon:yes stop_codon:yes gene_type:complete